MKKTSFSEPFEQPQEPVDEALGERGDPLPEAAAAAAVAAVVRFWFRFGRGVLSVLAADGADDIHKALLGVGRFLAAGLCAEGVVNHVAAGKPRFAVGAPDAGGVAVFGCRRFGGGEGLRVFVVDRINRHMRAAEFIGTLGAEDYFVIAARLGKGAKLTVFGKNFSGIIGRGFLPL